ncbi:Protein unc-119 homolog A [Durusdinium trenchii]|uniref:Protein unc-119 homolog A n=1 Tax=Durusdinium trenchii TaxID=1381693 RepID=A0ABP0QYX8_9DINO
MSHDPVTPEEVLKFKAPTKGFLCPLSANKYGIDFLSFKIRDYDTQRTIFDVSRENAAAAMAQVSLANLSEDSYRKIRYNFSEDVLRTPTISTTLTFAVGDHEVEDFRMIERHYFRDQLVKSWDFTFGFCIPSSTNTWEAVYAVPMLDEELIDEMIANPFETRSDSFYFVNGELVMHNKAEYNYCGEPAEAKPTAGAPRAGAKAGAKQATPGMKYAAKMSAAAPGKTAARAIPAEAKAGAKASF